MVISDGSPDGAQLVAFWREEIPEDFVSEARHAFAAHRRPDPFAGEPDDGRGLAGRLRQRRSSSSTRRIRIRPPPPLSIIGNAFLAGITRKAPLGAQKFEWNGEENRFTEGLVPARHRQHGLDAAGSLAP